MSKLNAAKSAIESEIARLESQLSRLQQSLAYLNSAIDQPVSGAAVAGTPKAKKVLKALPKAKVLKPALDKKTTKAPAKKTAKAAAAIPAKKTPKPAKAGRLRNSRNFLFHEGHEEKHEDTKYRLFSSSVLRVLRGLKSRT